jgi:hypothetical protein
MKLYTLVFYSMVLVNGALRAMEKEIEQKLELKEMLYKTRFKRPIPHLVTKCLPSLALYIIDKINHDPSFTLENFMEYVGKLAAHNVGTQRFFSILHEELNEVPFEKHGGYLGIDQLHFANEKIIWSVLTDDSFVIRSRGIKDKDQVSNITSGSRFGMPGFAVSANFFCFPYERALYFSRLDGYNSMCNLALPSNDSEFTDVVVDHKCARCAIGNKKGEIFIATLHDFDTKEIESSYKLKKQIHKSEIVKLHFTPNSHLISCDVDGNIALWSNLSRRKKYVGLLPFKKRVRNIVSSADSAIVAFQHYEPEEHSASILDLNSFMVYENKFGKIIAITESHKILATDNEHLCTYGLDGTLLKKAALPKTAKLYGNEMPAFSSIPLYLMTTEEKVTKEVNIPLQHQADDFTRRLEPIDAEYETKKIEEVKTSFWLPKQFSPELLFEKLIENRSTK